MVERAAQELAPLHAPGQPGAKGWETDAMILVAGATSQIGGSVVERLLADRREVRVLVRRAEDAEAFRELGCDAVQGRLVGLGSRRWREAGGSTIRHGA